jgi:hypothetical protein
MCGWSVTVVLSVTIAPYIKTQALSELLLLTSPFWLCAVLEEHICVWENYVFTGV